MPEYADVYALSRERKESAVLGFLEVVAPQREECSDEYEIPQYSPKPSLVLKSATDLIRHCCANTQETHSIYWRITSGPFAYAMVFFLQDGRLIFGISVPAEGRQGVEAAKSALLSITGSKQALVRWEQPPPESEEEFILALASA